MVNKIPDSIYQLMQLSKWIQWDVTFNQSADMVDKYNNARLWLWHWMIDNNVKENIANDVNVKNYLRVWFYLDRKLDTSSLRDMKHLNYKFMFMSRGYSMIDLTVDKK